MPNKSAATVTVAIQNAAQIEAVKAEVLRQEQSGQFNTVHHEVLRNLIAGSVAVVREQPKETVNPARSLEPIETSGVKENE